MLSSVTLRGHSRDLRCRCMTETDRQEFTGRPTLSQSATFPIPAPALASAWGSAGRQIAAWLAKQVAQAAERLTWAQAAPSFVQTYPGVFKALGFCKPGQVCSAARGLRDQSPWKISSIMSLFLACWQKKIKHHHCQPRTCWTVEEMGCFLHLPALLTKLTGIEDRVLSCRLGLVDRAREDGGISDLVWTCSLTMPSKEISLGLSNEHNWQGATRKGNPKGNREHIQTPSDSSRSFPESNKSNHWSQSYSYPDPRLITLSALGFVPLCLSWASPSEAKVGGNNYVWLQHPSKLGSPQVWLIPRALSTSPNSQEGSSDGMADEASFHHTQVP